MKKLLSVFSILSIPFLLAACGGSSEQEVQNGWIRPNRKPMPLFQS